MSLQHPYNNNAPAILPTSPPRRQHAVQPPGLLTTSLENARNANLGIGAVQHTPLSTTSLSSPFSAHPHSAYPASPAETMRGNSPMTFRHTSSFPTAYNPQQWGPLTSASSQVSSQTPHNPRVLALAPRPVGPDEPVASPPPPYSPRRETDSQESPRIASDTISPSDTTSPDTDASRHTTPLTSANALSPDFLSRQSIGRAATSHSTNASPSLGSTPTFPPPPPAQGSASRLRSSSKDHAGRLLSSLTSRNKNNATSPVSAIDALQVNTAQALAQGPDLSLGSPTSRAPAARRAASTGDITLARDPSRSANKSPAVWEPGMNIPPPPPGPPPAAARTQSLNRPMESPSVERGPSLPVRARRPPGHGTSLDTVPPTPADWREESLPRGGHTRDGSNGPAPLHIDTGSIIRKTRPGYEDSITAPAATPFHRRRDSSAAGLVRTPAVRNRSSKGLRERRSESKQDKERGLERSAVEPQSSVAPWDDESLDLRPSNLNLSSNAMGNPSRRDTTRRTPGSGKALQSLDGTLNSAGKLISSGKAVSFEAAFSSNRSPPIIDNTDDSTPTPPASAKATEPQIGSAGLCSRRSLGSPQKLTLTMPSGSEQRPISHILHVPNPDDALQVPLTPLTSAKERPVSDLLGPESPRAFAERAMERHRTFAKREAAAINDSEKVEIFLQFMIAESRIRREQYAQVFESGDIDVDEIVKDLFRPATSKVQDSPEQRPLAEEDASRRTSIASSGLGDSSSQDEVSSFSRKHESPSSATTNSSIPRPASGMVKDYVPCLSPIASMSIVTGQDDEMNSRGRAPSRWWEDPSQSESAANDGFNVLGRSKRESKYMGVPREARNSTAFFEQRMPVAASNPPRQAGESSQNPTYGPNEYPPEKIGWHDEVPAMAPTFQPPTPASAPPFTPDARGLDISRLVTLPPPYPRHHPAVNNNHPDLADTRAVVRTLHEKDSTDSIRTKFASDLTSKRKRAESWCEHQRSLHRQDVQFRIEHGEITQDQYDELETELEQMIEQSDRDITQAEFDLFQNTVVSPLHALFAERIGLATSSLEKLSSRLFSDAQYHSPNLPQEEGDEQPELLEKLTQLKWLFEGRETLHRQTYDLLSERNDKYKAIVLLPYKQTKNTEKYTDAEKFFAQDARDRKVAFERQVSDRAHAFLTVVEHNVARGVEVQLDAFWQIAPSLREVLHKLPSDLSNVEIRIPADEYVENPSYYDHPLQYLYSLLGHAEKSTYQFIESQTNLLCLLHEIRSCALNARCRVEGNERPTSDVETYLIREEKRLTEDLKEKVGVLEGQWGEALGEELLGVRERVRGRLLEDGGWDDDEEDI